MLWNHLNILGNKLFLSLYYLYIIFSIINLCIYYYYYISDSFNGSELIEVDVSDNALGSKGVYSCRNVLSGKKLEKLYVCNNGLAAETAVLISEILLENGCPDLKLLHFYNNMSGDDGAIAVGGIIKCLPSLNNLRFSGTRSQKKGCFAIADAICSITTLKYLDIADNMFKGILLWILHNGFYYYYIKLNNLYIYLY